MEWLLTLFAMLGAVTGAHGGVPGAPAQVQQAEATRAVQAAVAVAEAAVVREAPPAPELAATPGDARPLPARGAVAAPPLYADRLRE